MMNNQYFLIVPKMVNFLPLALMISITNNSFYMFGVFIIVSLFIKEPLMKWATLKVNFSKIKSLNL